MRLIDADALIEAWDLQNCKKYGNETTEELSCSYATMSLYEVKDMIDDAPTVDAVEVVRCKDCKNLYADDSGKLHWCDFHRMFVGLDDFCNYGKRMDGGESDD